MYMLLDHPTHYTVHSQSTTCMLLDIPSLDRPSITGQKNPSLDRPSITPSRTGQNIHHWTDHPSLDRKIHHWVDHPSLDRPIHHWTDQSITGQKNPSLGRSPITGQTNPSLDRPIHYWTDQSITGQTIHHSTPHWTDHPSLDRPSITPPLTRQTSPFLMPLQSTHHVMGRVSDIKVLMLQCNFTTSTSNSWYTSTLGHLSVCVRVPESVCTYVQCSISMYKHKHGSQTWIPGYVNVCIVRYKHISRFLHQTHMH